MHTIAENKLLMLKPSQILPSRSQPRKSFDEYELKLLADSIAASGIIQPLTVRKNSNGEFELIAGERRLKAARLAGLRRVPCVLHKTDDATAAFYSVIENLQRSDLTFFEEAAAIERLTAEHHLTQSEVAIRLGIAQSTLCNKLRLLRLDGEMQERILSARLTERHARALLRVDEQRRTAVLDRIIAEGLTLQQTEELIDGLVSVRRDTAASGGELSPDKEPPRQEDREAPIRKSAIGDVRLFSNSLTKLLDTMRNAGFDARSRRHETDKYIEYRVRISKSDHASGKYQQLKIC